MIKVLTIIPELNIGGAEKLVRDMAINIDRTNFDMHVLSLFAKNGSQFEKEIEDSGIKVTGLDKKLGVDISMLFKLKKFILTMQPDIIHVHLNVLIYLSFLPKKYKKRIVFTVHNLAQFEAKGAHLFVQKKAYKIVQFVAISPIVNETVKRVYGKECLTINNGVMVDRYHCEREYSRQVRNIVSVSRLSAHKNQKLMIEAFSLLNNQDAKLSIYGEGELRGELQQQIDNLKLTNTVKLCGATNNVAEVLRQADIFILSSRDEGFGLVLVEAMASGLPIVNTINGSAEYIITDQVEGLLVENNCPEKLADAISQLIGDKDLRQRLGENAKIRANYFSVSKMMQQYQQLYREINAKTIKS